MKRIGIIGYGSMGKMLLEKFSEAGCVNKDALRIANRTTGKIEAAPDKYRICSTNIELARESDIVFICTRPRDILTVLEEIIGDVSEDALIVSLNGSILSRRWRGSGEENMPRLSRASPPR